MYSDYKPQPLKGKLTDKMNTPENTETALALNSNTAYTDTAELREKIKTMMLVSENDAPGKQNRKARICRVCGKEGSCQAIINHIEANHIVGIVVPCNVCGKTYSSLNALSVHKTRCTR